MPCYIRSIICIIFPSTFATPKQGKRRKHPMTANYQPRTGDVVHPYFKQKGYLGAAGEGWHGLSTKLPIQKAMMILSLVGALLLLLAQPGSAASTITQFKVPSPGVPQGIAKGPDGSLWFTLFYDNDVGRVTTKGTVTVFRLNSTLNSATYITAGPDGNLWLTLLNDVGGSTTNQIGRLTTSGKLITFTVPKASYIWDIATGPDGNLYFADGASRVWRVTPSGKFTAFPFTDSTGGYPWQITTGRDGNLWFTDRARQIVKMTPSGQFTTFPVPTRNGSTDDIVAGADGNLWFTLDNTAASR